jgi:hypothetical protein
VEELQEMTGNVVEEYKYPDNEDYNYVITEYSLDGEVIFYEGEVNSGSGIGADYAVFQCESLEEVQASCKEHLDHLIDMDFTPPDLVETVDIKGHQVTYLDHHGFYIAQVFKGEEFVNALSSADLDDLHNNVNVYLDSLE